MRRGASVLVRIGLQIQSSLVSSHGSQEAHSVYAEDFFL